MTKKRVGFLHVNYQQGPPKLNAFYLPYAAGLLWCYATKFDEIVNNYELGDIIWKRDNPNQVAEILSANDIIVVSGYVWNRRYNHAVLTKLKEIKPDVTILLGGSEYPNSDPDVFTEFYYGHIIVKTEGERAFKMILEEMLNESPDYTNIPGIIVNDNGKAVDTGKTVRIEDIDDVPSPYLAGFFDDIMKSNPDVTWNAVTETNRGCPYMCTFCSWGGMNYSKVKKYSLDRVLDELEWFGKNKINFLTIGDANFGIFPDRDTEIAKKLIEVRTKYGEPESYTMAWAKNQKSAVIDIAEILQAGGNRIGLNLSVQTLTDNTLEIIKRKNLGSNDIAATFAECKRRGIPVYSELILGLPEETLDSWKDNYYKLFELGNHDFIAAFQSIVLENTEMSNLQKEKYGLKTMRAYGNMTGIYEDENDKLGEALEVVVATDAMPHEDMVKALVHKWYATAFHIDGLTNFISRFLREYKNVSYRDFYEGLYTHIEKDAWFSAEIERIKKHSEHWLKTGQVEEESIAKMKVQWWSLVHTTHMQVQVHDKVNHIFNVIDEYVRTNYDLEPELMNDLLTLQRRYTIRYEDLADYPTHIDMKHDVYGYIKGTGVLEAPARYKLSIAAAPNGYVPTEFGPDKYTLDEYIQDMFYFRKSHFGKAAITHEA